jgi:predicted Zn-dependent protease
MELNLGACLYFGFLGYYVCRTQLFIKIYHDIVTSTIQNVDNFEDSAAGWRWKGGIERNLGQNNQAFDSYMMAWKLRPHDFVLNANIATILAGQHRYDEAKKFIDMANKAPLPNPELKAKWDLRMAEFEKVFETERNKSLARLNIGRNEPCKCGSGKKFKKCCGRSI